MSLWAKAQQLPPDCLQKVRSIYMDNFPIEVRHCLAPWIENRIWTTEAEEQQYNFVEELVHEINEHATLLHTPEMFVTKMKLIEAAKAIHLQYAHAPHELYNYMRSCLMLELDVIQKAMGSQYTAPPQTERKYSELIGGLRSVQQKVNQVSAKIRELEANMEAFSLEYHECVKKKAEFLGEKVAVSSSPLWTGGPCMPLTADPGLGHRNFVMQQSPPNHDRRDYEAHLTIQIEEQERKLNARLTHMNSSQLALVDYMKENITSLAQLQSQVLDGELIKWKREQQLSGNGVQMQTNLNAIQEWCELLADLIWTTRQQVNNVSRIINKTLAEARQPHLPEMLEECSKQVTSLLSTLVTSTFVIEKQPPQVMKTNTRFTATVRLLVGGQLNVYMTPPRVSVVIISEQQAQLLLKSDTQGGKSKQPVECGDILNNTGVMEYQATSRQLSVSFRNMQLRKIKRAEKKGTESVMDEKLTLLFQSQFNVGGGELVFQVWTLSLPVVVIVHGNQEPHGWATVTWDNAFSPSGRVPFAVPDKVTWGQLAETLRIKFYSATSGGDLSDDNLRFLAEKIFRANLPLNVPDLNAMPVSWTQFCKDALPERNFTFWEWFYQVVKVTREYLRTLWCDRLIMGFIQKKQAEDMLSKCPPGTFLLRFSDSELGGITIAWVGDGNEVFSLQPFTARDLALRSLADRVLDLPQLQFLYPNIAKDDVFSKYYTKPENEMLKNGYVKPVLVTTLPNFMSSPAYASPDTHRGTPSVQSSDLFDMQSFDADDLDYLAMNDNAMQ
ncbi:signal transducer and activator of transcription 5B isoform X4 [Amyelois transitella]|uniref:signal transducer and activator of transcription 5B isoform X4 n=1 Tax=Amyelois transitella TaxID=680683 RepID=UPI00298FB4B6|nr:signal transducer and activator of transcription 5B isoform X4 [Amyelois transitella]